MSVEENKAIARRFIGEVWTEGNLDVADEILVADMVWHDTKIKGIEPFKKNLVAFRTDFPDERLTCEELVAEGDKVAARIAGQGTHAPTGKRATWTAIAILRITDGKIVEMWSNEDLLGRLQQIGFELVPPKGQSEA